MSGSGEVETPQTIAVIRVSANQHNRVTSNDNIQSASTKPASRLQHRATPCTPLAPDNSRYPARHFRPVQASSVSPSLEPTRRQYRHPREIPRTRQTSDRSPEAPWCDPPPPTPGAMSLPPPPPPPPPPVLTAVVPDEILGAPLATGGGYVHSLLLASHARQVVFGPVLTHFTFERRHRTHAIDDRIVFRFGVRSHDAGFGAAVSSGAVVGGLAEGIWGCVSGWKSSGEVRYKPCLLVGPF